MDSEEQTLRKPSSPSGLKSTTPLGGRPKSKMNAGGSGLSRSATISHSPPHRTFKTASPSRGPGLTVRIEHDMTTNICQSIQSAPPARTRRRLPAPPLSSIIPTTPTTLPNYFSSASLTSNNPLTPRRTPRPLPCPPPLSPLSKDRPYCFTTNPEVSPSTAPSPLRVVRPLPTPVHKVDPLPLNLPPMRTSSPQPLAPVSPFVLPDCTSPLKPLGGKNNYSEEKTILNGSRIPRKDDSSKSSIIHLNDGEEEGVYDKENQGCDGDTSLLQKRVVFLAPPRPSLDSDISTSDDSDFSENSFSNIVVPADMSIKLANSPLDARSSPTMGDIHTNFNFNSNLEHGEEEIHVDYAWVLSGHFLYRQKNQPHVSKWVREKKGKRYTEQDYENVLKVLRTL